MSDRIIYALNTTSGVVTKLDADLLAHPVLGKDYVEVDEPDSCISCGVQPTEVTTVHGDDIVLAKQEEVELPASPKPSKPAKEAK